MEDAGTVTLTGIQTKTDKKDLLSRLFSLHGRNGERGISYTVVYSDDEIRGLYKPSLSIR